MKIKKERISTKKNYNENKKKKDFLLNENKKEKVNFNPDSTN